MVAALATRGGRNVVSVRADENSVTFIADGPQGPMNIPIRANLRTLANRQRRYDSATTQDPTIFALDLDTDERFVPLRKLLGVSGFGINQLTLRPGQRMRIHRHAGQEEVYLVFEGRLTVLVEGVAHTVAAGELMRIAPEIRRQLVNTHRQRVTLVALGSTCDGHESRDAEAFNSWEETAGGQPRDVALPDDLPDSELLGLYAPGVSCERRRVDVGTGRGGERA
jgi:quercetin dioxygenase-like cupin family protein